MKCIDPKAVDGEGARLGVYPDLVKSLFISDTQGQEEAARQKFAAEGLALNFDTGSRYLGAYLGPQKELVAWIKPQVEARAQGVIFLCKIA